MTAAENIALLRECDRMGRGDDFCWGRIMVIEQCDDIPHDALVRLCRFHRSNLNEVQQGIDYQRSIFRAAELLVARQQRGEMR